MKSAKRVYHRRVDDWGFHAGIQQPFVHPVFGQMPGIAVIRFLTHVFGFEWEASK